jgi:membrane protease YdiL (CAAX protease family)
MTLQFESRRTEWLALFFACTYPTLLTLVYFIWLASVGSTAQQAAYSIGKIIQFGFPLVWVAHFCRESLRWPKFNTRGLAQGIAFGLMIAAGIFALYFGHYRAAGTFAAAGDKMLHELSGIGVTSPVIYAGVAIFYSLLHSLLEEYYWRWFVFGRLRNLIPLWLAIIISSLAFMGHHVVVLGLYFGWKGPEIDLVFPFIPWTHFFALATAVGGAYWAWLYNKTGSIYGPWASHLLIDAAIFAVGYDLIHAAS